jgi:hypothetical protein
MRPVVRFSARALVVVASALAAISCGSDDPNGPGTSPIIITTTVNPTSLIPGQSFTATVTATPPVGEKLSWVKVEVRGLFTAADSARVEGDGSATIARVFQVPRTVTNGSITIVGSARAANGHAGTGEANVAVADNSKPNVSLAFPQNVTTLQPGDSLRLSLFASDNVGLKYTVIRVTGAFTLVDSVAYTSTGSTSRTLAVKIPVLAKLGTPISATADAADYAGNTATVTAGPVDYKDLTAPTLSVQTSGGRNGAAFAPGDVLTLAVSASDNHHFGRVGYRLLPPASGGDSSTITTATYTQNLTIPISASWAGTPSFVVFAVDSSGNRRQVSGTITVVDRPRRGVVTASLAPAVRDVAVDQKRGRIYLSVPSANAVKVLDVASGTFGADITMPVAPSGIDLSTGGDSLLIAQANGPFVRIVSLVTGAQDTVRVMEPGDTRPAQNLRVLADNTMLVSITFAGSGYGGSIGEYDLGTGTRRSRVTVTEAVPIARSGNRQRAVAIIDDSCCPLGGMVYDVVTHSWSPERGTVGQYFVTVSMDFTGSRVLVASTLFSESLTTLGAFNPAGTSTPAVVANDGASAFWATATGVSRVRFADAAVLDTYNLGAKPTALFLSPDGLTLVALTSGKVSVIDLW